ncbi:TPA: chromosome partitioning protein ParB [Pseudomonas aeruginosa]|uniref:chromosome partitioning protein ParB n=1 Tax=Burkholderia multivorans TaxID=87883 RepID=UPI001A2E671C|nr:chromosome partitioning protein ParB [Burkholderia multivorans]MBH4533147.1 chromosome partitioning protein ParB [Pseudomonas aeruginosa]MBR7922776.1 chromosome partitioning protein ParB [Burkholderia multivorans]MBV6099816.1 chromosome partitioning protein ParB [Pseudomonas aeruginosa]HBO5311231.1 chromosome partitioning protein ParB [Pseudomonas aeruginosa]HBP4872684.1 chromosome partitioning protein ParB [Pseudomonas aeruginosa]
MKKQGRPSATKNKAAMPSNSGGGVLMKRVNFQLPADQHMKLKVYAAQHGKTITELLTEHVEQLLCQS